MKAWSPESEALIENPDKYNTQAGVSPGVYQIAAFKM